MASKKIKGITIELGGDTSSFVKALKEADSAIRQTNQNLSSVNKALKLDPGNTDLLKSKQELLADAVKNTENRLRELKDALSKADDPEMVKALNAEIAETEAKLKNAKKEADEFGSVFKQKMEQASDSIKEASAKITDVGKSLTATVTAPIAGLATAGIAYNAEIEKYRTLLTTLTGSAEQADKTIKQLQEDASKSPFDTKSLIEANQYLLSAGVEADDAREAILNLANAVAATGGGSSELSRMAQNLQQIKNVGKASAQDIKQFANAGINVYGLLADSMGVTVAEVKDMEVSYEDLTEAFAKASQEGGIYFGAMEAQSETLNGMTSTLKDNFQQTLGELTENLLPIIKDLLSSLNDFLLWLKDLDPETQKVIVIIAGLVAALGPLLMIIGSIGTGISVLVGAIGAITAPMLAVIAVIAILVAAGVALYKNWDEICEWAQKTWQSVTDYFTQLKDDVVAGWDLLKQTAKDKWEEIKTNVSNKVEETKEKVVTAWENTKELCVNKWEQMKDKTSSVFNTMKENILTTWDSVKQLAGEKLNNFVDDIKNKFNTAKDYISDIVDKIKDFFNFDFKWPHIPLPHFSISGSSNPLDWFYNAPRISVDWYKKAQNTPYLFNTPQIIGVGDVPEVVIGADAFKKMQGGQTVINQTINATVRNDQDIDILARKISQRIQTDVTNKTSSWR
jgi:tape measure domain-containing protein